MRLRLIHNLGLDGDKWNTEMCGSSVKLISGIDTAQIMSVFIVVMVRWRDLPVTFCATSRLACVDLRVRRCRRWCAMHFAIWNSGNCVWRRWFSWFLLFRLIQDIFLGSARRRDANIVLFQWSYVCASEFDVNIFLVICAPAGYHVRCPAGANKARLPGSLAGSCFGNFGAGRNRRVSATFFSFDFSICNFLWRAFLH